jgi:hypothetical protein
VTPASWNREIDMYREQEFVERCVCEDPVAGACVSCGRARCAFHLKRGMCSRCNEAIGREMAARSSRWFWLASTLGVTVAVGLAIAHTAVGLLIGGGLAVSSYLAMRARARRRLIARMGPSLSAFIGELPPPVRTIDVPPDDESIPAGSSIV